MKQEQINQFFERMTHLVDRCHGIMEDLEHGTYLIKELEQLEDLNETLFQELKPEHYSNSYANPVYMEQLFGAEGKALCALYTNVRSLISAAYKKDLNQFEKVKALMQVAKKSLEDQTSVSQAMKTIMESHLKAQYKDTFNETYGGVKLHYHDITMNADLSDLRYLYAYGIYVTPYEHQTAAFLNAYDENNLKDLADSIAKAYVSGFKRDNKDMSKRHHVRVVSVAGQERLTRLIIKALESYNLTGFVSTVQSTDVNKQYEFDHRFDKGLYLDEAYNQLMIEAIKEAAEDRAAVMGDYSGILYIEKFGEEPFSPLNNDARIKLDETQQKLHQAFQIEYSQLNEKYIPETERSFCIVAFPSPEIGEQFEDIFADTVRINQMDSDAYEIIQQVIIDALDKGEFVHVKGYKGNETDILVKLNKLSNPEKETNFVNCVADVNIPVGEVFTSPVLKDTTGLLHVDTVYLNNFNYENLRLDFKDGYIDSYSCSNFEDAEKGKEYVRENLLFPHQTLPLGEFAIGTNTLAYVIGEKYGIVDKMPILIVEKMGPHFAIGDTCFSWGEDNPVYNPTDGKEIVARDNERSILRKEDVTKAYTNCHTDITIPYDSLEHITVIQENGEKIAIIEKGRFVLKGTEALNIPFDQEN